MAGFKLGWALCMAPRACCPPLLPSAGVCKGAVSLAALPQPAVQAVAALLLLPLPLSTCALAPLPPDPAPNAR